MQWWRRCEENGEQFLKELNGTKTVAIPPTLLVKDAKCFQLLFDMVQPVVYPIVKKETEKVLKNTLRTNESGKRLIVSALNNNPTLQKS